MKTTLLIVTVLVAVLIPSAVSATSLGWGTATSGGTTTYTYTLQCSDEFGFPIVSLHVYAPISPGLILSGSNDRGWSFAVDIDEESGGADICWFRDDDSEGLPEEQWMAASFTVPSWTTTTSSYILPGTFGNWGYETELFEGYELISFPPVGVPEGIAPAVPEPGGLVAMAAGIGLLCGTRRRRVR